MSSHSETSHSAVGAQHHITPVWQYTLVFAALLVLMGITIGASYISMGTVVNNVLAMAIALLKGSLVVAIFMGVMHGSKLIKFWAISGLSCILLFTFIGIDYWTRGNGPESVIPGFYHDEGSALHSGNLPNDPSTMKPVTQTPKEIEEERQKN